MTQTQYFSSGLELANFVVVSDILQQAWTAISELYKETSQEEPSSLVVKFKIYEPPNCTIIAFFTWPANSKDCVQGNEGGDFVTSSALKGYFPHFNFLCTKSNQKFSINKPALELFISIFDVLPKSVMTNSKPLIITGNSLGGSVASLFTLSLLEKINFSNTKRPLCITFGSPLIGDEDLQEAISKYAAWNSCFLHVVSDQDPVPRVLINGYQPFGTFLLCSKLGCSCFEDPRTILELLMATYSGSPGNQDHNLVFVVYGTFVKDINRKVICMDTTMLPERTTQPLRACITTQIVAAGLMQPEQQQRQNVDVNIIIRKIEKREKLTQKKEAFDPTKRLKDIKVCMAYLEWYKKLSKDDGIGYYDRYKNESRNGMITTDMYMEKYKKSLTIYWKDMVDQAEERPQTVGAFLRTWALFGGANYRRMIEPLDIADYYNKGLSDYINNGRSEHYKKLEQWLKETGKPSSSSGPNDLKKQNVKSSLTEDSCFWAHVEEARILCELLTGRESSVMNKESSKKNRKSSAMDEESSKKKLVEFENYVYGLMKNYAVSSEIFLPKSSFMKWWGEYREIMGTSYSSSLTNLLKNDKNYEAYATGLLEFPNDARVPSKVCGQRVPSNVWGQPVPSNSKRQKPYDMVLVGRTFCDKEDHTSDIRVVKAQHDTGYEDTTFLDKQEVVQEQHKTHKTGYEDMAFLDKQEYETLEIRFSSGLELANFVVSSGVLNHSWAAVQDLYSEINQNEQPSLSVRHKVSQQPNCTIIAFVTWPVCSKDHIQGGGGGDLVSSSTHKESFPLFEFLRTKTNPDFSINKAALELFASIRDRLPSLKSEIDSRVVIITGNYLGGSVASLFTLWLLDSFNLSTKIRPLCITFGSPLVGDDCLQEAISKYPTWNSCFLHVVSDQDPIPRVLISPSPMGLASQTNVYKPFGTFLLCSELGCACFEDSQSILELLMATYSDGPENQNPNQVLEFYEALVQHLNHKVICKDATQLVKRNTESLKAGIITQLAAIGLERPQQQQQNNGINSLITKTERQEKKLVILKSHAFDPSKKLNDIEINMVLMEWYKKYFKGKGIGYYDSYKNLSYSSDLAVVSYKKMLTSCWEELVDEVEKMPQKEGVSFRTQLLSAGTDYRRMIEPLDIAEYYNRGLKDYINQGRPKHYKQLEQWLNVANKPASNSNQLKKQNVASILSKDSCFWAHVEEARISCKLLTSRESSIEEKKSSKHNLIKFENYVLCLMKNDAVSPEIFLPWSSYMLWWKEYERIIRKEIMGTCYTSDFTDLMKDRSYQKYSTGCLEIL